MNDTADLTNAEVGDACHLRNGTAFPITEIAIGRNHPVLHISRDVSYSWALSGRYWATAMCADERDVIRLEKRSVAAPCRLTPDVVWGMSVPGTEPVAKREEEEYAPLSNEEADRFMRTGRHVFEDIKAAHRAGWFKRRTEAEP